MQNENLLRENARLRTDNAKYQSAMEAMELRAQAAEKTSRELLKKLKKISELLSLE